MITVRKNRSVHIPQSDRQIGFENDHLVETRYFEITDPDILDFSFKLDIKNTMDIVDLYPVEKSDTRTVMGHHFRRNRRRRNYRGTASGL